MPLHLSMAVLANQARQISCSLRLVLPPFASLSTFEGCGKVDQLQGRARAMSEALQEAGVVLNACRARGELVLFPFDHTSWPLRDHLKLELKSFGGSCGKTKIVLPKGLPGQPDAERVIFYGSVVDRLQERRRVCE